MVDSRGGRGRRSGRRQARGSTGIAPQRTCIGCRRLAPPEELVRVVAEPGGGLAVGRTLPGRGAWLCAGSAACVDAAARRKAFDRALRTTVRAGAVDDLKPRVVPRGRIES